MENASKALIIAGAILLSIILITLGIVVVRNVMPTINSANTNQQEVEAFNSKFETYVGNNKTATDVRSLYSAVISSNGAQTQNSTTHFIGKGTTEAPKTYPTDVTMPNNLTGGSTTYTITLNYGTDGYVCGFTHTP